MAIFKVFATGFRTLLFGLMMLSVCSCQTLFPLGEHQPSWQFIATPSEVDSTTHAFCAVDHGKFFAFGGIQEGAALPLSNQLISYNFEQKEWSLHEPKNGPSPLNFSSQAICQHSLLVFGGESNDKRTSNDAFVFDTQVGQWSQILGTEGTDPRRMASATCVGDQLVIMGGKSELDIKNWARYDTKQRQWLTQSNRGLEPRVSAVSLGLDKNHLFVWGGFVGMTKQADGFILDIFSNQVTPIPATPVLTGRANARAISFQNKIYIWGGSTIDNNSNSGAVYDRATHTWLALPKVPEPRFSALKGSELLLWKGRGLMIVGGRFGSDQFNSDLWYLDFKEKTWIRLNPQSPIPGRIAHCALAASLEKILVFGGIGYKEGTQSLTVFDGLWILDSR